VNVVASVQYRAVADKASDAFYRLTNTREQIQSYVFDGMCSDFPFHFKLNYMKCQCKIVLNMHPMMCYYIATEYDKLHSLTMWRHMIGWPCKHLYTNKCCVIL